MKPYDAPTGTVWSYLCRSERDFFVVLDGFADNDGLNCRHMFVLHSDSAPGREGFSTFSMLSPYNNSSERVA